MSQTLLALTIIIPIVIYVYTMYILKSNYKKEYNKEISGFEKARKILNSNKCKDFIIIEKKGTFTDSYDIKRETLKLSSRNYHENTITSVGISSFISYQIIYDKENGISKYKNAIDNILNYVLNTIYILLLLGLLIHNIRLINYMLYSIIILLLYFTVTSNYKYNIIKIIKEKEPKDYELLKQIYQVMIIFDFTKIIQVILDDINYIKEKINAGK